MPSLVSAPHFEDEETASDGGHSSAWVDSDDERIIISLATNPRLRKLRTTESEGVVNGKEYIKRLRWHYERLHPAPQWARQSTARSKLSRKKRRFDTGSSDGSETASDDDFSDSTGDRSVQPLAKLLQNITGLTNPSRTTNSYTKLRPEIIDVHRLKDIGDIKPVGARRNPQTT